MTKVPKFGVFDCQAETKIDIRNLPHWFQPGVATFVTFRTADSMPREVVLRWRSELRDWLTKYGFAVDDQSELPSVDSVPQNLRGEYRKQQNRLWNWKLDECHGACVLRRREFARIVMDALLHFNGDRYELASAIVMPNHEHLIARFNHPTTCRKQCTSWLRYTATRINRRIGGDGAFWRSEPFDHLVRSEQQFHYLQAYVTENGTRAKLPSTDFLSWRYDSPSPSLELEPE